MNRDLTKGDPGSVLWRFCLPLFFSVIFQQLYVVTDSLVAGRFVGEDALAAVGNTYQITLIYQALAFGATMGCSVVVSRLFGAGDGAAVQSAISTALIACAGLCALLTLAGLLGGDALLRLVRTPGEVFAASKQYLDIYTAGLCFLFLYQIALGIFSALGDAKTPFYFLTASSIVNIALDVLFVVRFHMGVAGVAWATFLCQALGAIAAVAIVLRRMRLLRTAAALTEKTPPLSRPLLAEMLRIAWPITLQQLVVSIGNVCIQANVNSFGANVSAGYAAAIKMNNMAIAALMVFDKGMTSFAAQNIGAKKPERILSGLRATILFSVSSGVLIAAGFLLFRVDLLRLFMKSSSTHALASGVQFFLIVVPFYLLVSIKIACDGTLRGLGAMRQLFTGTFVDLSLRVGFGFLFASLWGPIGIWAAWPIGWITGTALSGWFTARVLHRYVPAQEHKSD